MDDEDLLNIRCPYCEKIFTFAQNKVPRDKPFLNARCPYCEEGIVLPTEALLKLKPVKAKRKK